MTRDDFIAHKHDTCPALVACKQVQHIQPKKELLVTSVTRHHSDSPPLSSTWDQLAPPTMWSPSCCRCCSDTAMTMGNQGSPAEAFEPGVATAGVLAVAAVPLGLGCAPAKGLLLLPPWPPPAAAAAAVPTPGLCPAAAAAVPAPGEGPGDKAAPTAAATAVGLGLRVGCHSATSAAHVGGQLIAKTLGNRSGWRV